MDAMTFSTTWRWMRPLLLCLASATACLAAWWFFVTTPRGARLDDIAYRGSWIGGWIVSDRSDRLLRVVSVQGVAVVMAAVALTALLRRRWMLALEAAAVVAASNVTTQVLKYHLLTRPNWGFDGFSENSYPSGHTTAAASAMVAAVLVAPRALRAVVALVGAVVMVAFGYGTLAAHWHRPSDVIGGFLVCFSWAFAALFVGAVRQALLGRQGAERPDPRRPSRAMPLLMLLAGLVATGIAAWCGWQTWPWATGNIDRALRHQQFVAYLGASSGICGLAFCGMAVLLRLVDLHDARAGR